MRRFSLVVLCLFLSACAASNDARVSKQSPAAPIDWQPWSPQVFAQAKAEQKLVLLDLGAVWCHWCHVMDEQTYQNPAVMRLMNDGFIAVRVDQDARPDLSMRYEDYGWPATIIFDPSRNELIKRRGYIPPKPMAAMLKAILADPTPMPDQAAATDATDTTNTTPTQLTDAQRQTLKARLADAYDHKLGGWGTSQKFLVWDNVTWCMNQRNEPALQTMARQTLDAQLNLMDPVWGGVYQYSAQGDWQHPHFEKIMQMQANNLQVYARASHHFDEPRYLAAALAIRKYLKNFLTAPNGGFYTSQDADLIKGQHSEDYFKLNNEQRRSLGMPHIDKHQYARENGWAIEALCALAADEPAAVTEAITAAKWVIQNRSLDGGGFSHDAKDPAGPYLGDTLAMGQAFLALYQVTADKTWLTRAANAADFIASHFQIESGVATTIKDNATGLKPLAHKEQNIQVARFANLLFHHTGQASHQKLAQQAMQFLTTSAVALDRSFAVGGLLLVDKEMAADPLHIVIVGPFDAPATQALWRESLAWFSSYKRIDVVDPAAGHEPMNSQVTYPQLKEPAAFFCVGNACSAPVKTPAALHQLLLKRSK